MPPTSLVAYEYRPAHQPDGDTPVTGLSIQVGDGVLLDVHGAMYPAADADPPDVEGIYASRGVIVVDTAVIPNAQTGLDANPFLKRTGIPDDIDVPTGHVDPALAGLSGAANEGRAVDEFGVALDEPLPSLPLRASSHHSDQAFANLEGNPLDTMTVKAMRALAAERGIDLEGATRREDIMARIQSGPAPEQTTVDTTEGQGEPA